MTSKLPLIFALSATLSVSASAMAGADRPDPDATSHAVHVLLVAADAVIPETSSCHGIYPLQQGEPRIRDLLATSLGGMQEGNNKIDGACTASTCRLNLQHAHGEDVWSTQIRYEINHGALEPGTLKCVMTP